MTQDNICLSEIEWLSLGAFNSVRFQIMWRKHLPLVCWKLPLTDIPMFNFKHLLFILQGQLLKAVYRPYFYYVIHVDYRADDVREVICIIEYWFNQSVQEEVITFILSCGREQRPACFFNLVEVGGAAQSAESIKIRSTASAVLLNFIKKALA